MAELERMAAEGPDGRPAGTALRQDARVAPITLEGRPVRGENTSMSIRPPVAAISEAKLGSGQAALDWVFFNTAVEQHRRAPSLSPAVGPPDTNQHSRCGDVGLRQRLTTGVSSRSRTSSRSPT